MRNAIIKMKTTAEEFYKVQCKFDSEDGYFEVSSNTYQYFTAAVGPREKRYVFHIFIYNYRFTRIDGKCMCM